MKNFFFCVTLFPALAFAHGGKAHPEIKKIQLKPRDSILIVYKSVTEDYKIKVEKIFESKCFDCHSSKTAYPWYYQIPGVNLVMNSHIKDARGHIDMTNGFPFKSHETPLEDLKELEKTIVKGSMPPWYYTLFHKDSSITPTERKVVLDWIKTSIEKLKELE